MSEITKKALSNSLQQLCKYKHFEKISINDITNDCNLNRQTFYYHFQDKYDLLKWVYYDDLFKDLMNTIHFDNWDQCLLQVLLKIHAKQEFYSNTINDNEYYFNEDLFNLSKSLFINAIDLFDLEHKVDKEEKQFFASFYAYGICGTVIHWIKTGMKESPEILAKKMKNIALNSEKFAYHIFIQENN